MASTNTAESETAAPVVVDLVQKVFEAPHASYTAGGGNSVQFLPIAGLTQVKDINESIVKVGESKEFDSKEGGLVEITAISSEPQFSLIHLQLILYAHSYGKLGHIFEQGFKAQILKVASLGGDCERLIQGVSISFDGEKEDVKTAMTLRDLELGDIFDPVPKDFHFILRESKRANPFHQAISSRSSGYLFSEEYSDVTVVCPDGTTFHAHRVFLTLSSPVLKTALSGSWFEENEGKYKTQIDSEIMKYILSFIYTGNFGVSFDSMDVDTLEKITEAGYEFEMDDLVKCCLKLLKMKVTVDDIKVAIAVAFRYKEPTYGSYEEGNELWYRCVEIIRENPLILTRPEIACCQHAYPELWENLEQDYKN